MYRKRAKIFYGWLPWLIVGVLAVWILFHPLQIKDTSKQDSEIKEIHSDRDSLTRIIELKNDTLAAIRGRAESAEFQVMKQRKENKQLIREKNEILFRIFSDTARRNAWAELYPTIFSR